LTEAETIKIEEEYFGKNNHFENILIAENDLIDAYIKDGLSPEDKSRFENRLLLNPRQRQRVQFAKTLVKYASGLPAAEDLNSAPAKSNWLSAFLQIFSLKQMPSLSFAVAAFIVFVGGLWLMSDKFNSQPSQTNEVAVSRTPQSLQDNESLQENESINETSESNEVAETKPRITPPAPKSIQPKPQPTRKEAAPKKQTPIFFSFVLSPGLTRAAGASQRFTIPPKTDFVKMQLKFEQGDFSSYQAALETVEGHQVWNSKRLKARKNDKVVIVLIPSKLLKKSDYILALKGVTKEGVYESVESYTFTINDK
jgi:hypothetical protein